MKQAVRELYMEIKQELVSAVVQEVIVAVRHGVLGANLWIDYRSS